MRLLRPAAFLAATLVSSVLLLGVLSLTKAQPAPRGGGAAAGNGDVNCDGRINITDPVYLLEWLFRGGPEPCALAQEAGPCCPDVVDRLDRIEKALLSARSWPPAPQDIVNVGYTTFNLSPGDSFVLYTVPKDRWFVLTDSNASGVPYLFEVRDDGETFKFRLGEVSQTGVTFSPGSKVVARNTNIFATKVEGRLAGYLARP